MKFSGSQPRRVLLRGVNWLGDAVLTLPAVEALRRLWPEAAFGVVAPEGLAPLWRMQPAVESLEASGSARGGVRLAEDLRLAGRLRRGRWDVAVIFPNSFRSALVPALAGVKRRVGFSTDGRRWLLTDPVTKTEAVKAQHQVEHYMALVRALGYEGPAPPVKLALSPEVLRWAEEAAKGLQAPGRSRPVVGIHPGATYGPAKRWFPERFAAVAEGAARDLDALVLVFGAAGEAPWAAEAASSRADQVFDMTGRTDVSALAAMLAMCDVLVCNDSGPMHLAAAIGTPVVAVFGSSQPSQTGPAGSGHKVVREPVECSPCFARTCPLKEEPYQCFNLISAKKVLEAVAESISADLATPLRNLKERQ